MFSKLEFAIALRYLKAKRKERFISVIAIFSFIGIMIGVATLIIVMSVMNGFRYELIGRILGINSHLTVYAKSSNGIYDYEKIITELKEIKGVTYVNPLVENQVMAAAHGRANGGLAKGIKLSDLENKKLITDNITHGNINVLGDKSSAIIGVTLAENLNLDIGDNVKLISPETSDTILGSIPRIKTYKIAGIFESGMYEYDSTTLFIPFESAQIHFKYRDAVSALEIFVEDPNNMSETSSNISRLLSQNYPNTRLVDWQQSNASFIDALKVESNVMFLILTLIILVAAFNIISSLIMLVNDKNKNIALLRTMGMSKNSIMKIFLICGSMIGVFGTLLGLVIGVLFSTNINSIKKFLEAMTGTNLFNPTIYFLSNLPSKIFVSDVVIIVGMSLILCFLATLYPAFKASKTNPAELLRYE